MVGAMKFLSRLPRFQSATVPTLPCKFNHQTTHAFTSLANSESEPRDVPEYFNFASDVLDKWSQREKEGKRPPNPAFWWVREKGEEVKWTFEELSYLTRKTANVLSEACNLCKGNRLLMILPRVPEWWLLSLACIRTEWMDLTSSDIIWGLSDPGWIKFAIGSFYSPWSQGSCIFQHGFLQFDPKVVLESLAKYPVTTFCGTPTIFRMLLQHNPSRYTFKSLRTCLGGGEPFNLDVLKEWKAETGFDIREGYGQTESSLLCSSRKGLKIKPGFIGKPLSGVDVRIIDENNNCLPPGEEGDIAVKIKPQRPVGLFSGYVDDPEKTAATERGDYYITGDRGLMDEDGYVQFIARADDIILSSGYRIGPFEVEYALMKHPAVAEAAVVSSPDPIRGEVVKAFIILTPAYQSQDQEKLSLELQGHVKKITAPYKYPRKIEFVQDLPKTISGKIKKRLLRKKEWETA
ncbi:acyl-coenzyme A synthetase ACSM3, mitochondrial-like [Notechis scutatus]|uniref:medium-chain acyl-CoA ligase n=1 Tax=Notechis scutatus TaxID=8663 RepID=A0A6J1VE95_9SAUR|nr:acyl-coenzyme A synthetase ACSM3, mitochondrial-like [Notechis scutatus]